MKFFNKMFHKLPTAQRLRLEAKEAEREQRQQQRHLDGLVRTKQQWIQDAVAAKQAGKQELVRDIFRKLRQVEIDCNYLSTDLRRLSLAGMAAKSMARKIEFMERSGDRNGLQALATRLRNSSLQKAIDTAAVDDSAFEDMLGEILGEEESAVAQTHATKEDAGFAEFDQAIGEMAEAEHEPNGSWKTASRIPRLAAASGSIRRHGISGVRTTAISGAIRSPAVSGAHLAAISGNARRSRVSEAYAAAISGLIRRFSISGASLSASGAVRRRRISGPELAAVSGRIRQTGISGAHLESVSGTVRRRPISRFSVSGKISEMGVSGLAFTSSAAVEERGLSRWAISGKASIRDESAGVSGMPANSQDSSRAKAVFEDTRPMPRIFFDGRCGADSRVVILEGFGKASIRGNAPDDRMNVLRPGDSTLVAMEDAAVSVRGNSVPIRGGGIRVGKGELTFLVDNVNAPWFVQEINSLLDTAVSGAGPAVGELVWTNNDGEFTNVRRKENRNWQTLVVQRDPVSPSVLAPPNEDAGLSPEQELRFSRIVVRPLAIGDTLTVHTIDGRSA